jgi:hypothetical protein
MLSLEHGGGIRLGQTYHRAKGVHPPRFPQVFGKRRLDLSVIGRLGGRKQAVLVGGPEPDTPRTRKADRQNELGDDRDFRVANDGAEQHDTAYPRGRIMCCP